MSEEHSVTELSMPPLLSDIEVSADQDPFQRAVHIAGDIESATVVWSPRTDQLTAALVVIPDRNLAESMLTVFAVACGLHDSLGALTPPETAVTHRWPNQVLVNGATCGKLRAAAPICDPNDTPAWLAVALELELAPMGDQPGDRPQQTSLAEEGCAHLTMATILPSWARHTLVWIYNWTEDGTRSLLDNWLAHAEDRGQAIQLTGHNPPLAGEFMGLGDHGDLLLKTANGMQQVPLTTMLNDNHQC